MARTIINAATRLSNQELEARLSVFLLNNRFQKAVYRGEELYRTGSALVKYGYFKVLYGNGAVHIEAFYVYKLREIDLDDRFQIDKYDLRGKLAALLNLLEVNPPAAGSVQPPPPQAPDYRQAYAPPYPNAAPRKKRGKGCLIAVLIVFGLLVGLIALIALYPTPEPADSPVARQAAVTKLAWKTLDEGWYTIRYPDDWLLTGSPIAKALSPGNGDEAELTLVHFDNSAFSYDGLTRDNIIGTIMDGEKYAGFTCETFEKGKVDGKNALFCLFTGELDGTEQTLYGYLAESGSDILWIYSVAQTGLYETYLPVMDTIVSSLKLK